MKRSIPKVRPSLAAGNGLATDMMAEAAATRLTPIDPTDIHAAPSPDIDLHVIKQYDHLAEEQDHLWSAEGEVAARPYEADAECLKAEAEADQARLAASTAEVQASAKQLTEVTNFLQRFVRREPMEYLRYNIFRLLLLGGDVAGGAGAAITTGEVVWLAVLQMLAAGTAAIAVAGLMEEVKHSRDTRKRAINGVPPGAENFSHLFVQPDPGESVVKVVLLGALAAVCLIFVAIFSLRTTTDGSQIGLLFGCLAVAITLGSGANSYTHADEIDDTLHGYRKRHRRALAANEKLKKKCTAPGKRAAALVRAQTIRAEYKQRGQAAVARVKAAGQAVLVANPGVAGNGEPRQPKTSRSDQSTTNNEVVQSTPADPPSPNGSGTTTDPHEMTGP